MVPAAPFPFHTLVGVGGIGTGILFALEGDQDLGRNESRPARLLDVRDYCKLHIIAHYPAVLLGSAASQTPLRVVPVGKIGPDEAGRRLRLEMIEAGMDVHFVRQVPDRPTLQSVCFQYPDGSGGNLTTSDSAAAALTVEDVDEVAALLGEHTIALAAPEVPVEIRHRLLEQATRRGAFRAAALTSSEAEEIRAVGLLGLVDLLALNEDEAVALGGVSLDAGDPRPCLEACAALLPPKARVVVTAGSRGAFALGEGGLEHRPAARVSVAGTAGAGDALLGGILTGLAGGAPFSEAFTLGACAAAFSITSPHTIPDGLSRGALLSFAHEHDIELPLLVSRLLVEAPE